MMFESYLVIYYNVCVCYFAINMTRNAKVGVCLNGGLTRLRFIYY